MAVIPRTPLKTPQCFNQCKGPYTTDAMLTGGIFTQNASVALRKKKQRKVDFSELSQPHYDDCAEHLPRQQPSTTVAEQLIVYVS